MKKMNLKKWGIVLLICQAVSSFAGIISGDYAQMLNQPVVLAIASFAGYSAMGIAGIVLIVKYNKNKAKQVKADLLDEDSLNK